MKRILSMLLVLLMLGGMLISCQSDQTGTPQGSQSSNGSGDVVKPNETIDSSDTDTDGYQKDRLPENLNYEMREVSILAREGSQSNTLPIEANAGDPIQDVSYWHIQSVQDRFKVVFEPTYVAAHYQGKATFMTAARAEDAAYDLISTYSLWPSVLAQEGRLANLRNLNYPDLEMPWWPASTDEWTQYGGLYFLGSNSGPQTINELELMFANVAMIEEEGLSDPVKAALRGTWTVEQVKTIVKKFAGVAEANPGEAYGIIIPDSTKVDALYYAAFANTKNNADGIAELAFDNAETLDLIDKYIDQWHEVFNGVETAIGTSDFAPMYNYQTALVVATVVNLKQVEDTTTYAAIPLPKMNDDQEKYRIICTNGFDLWCVPISAVDQELSGMIIEGVASSEYRTVGPFFFEQYLKRRYSSDAEGMRCFDLIRESMIYDWGRISQESLSVTLEGWWRNCFVSGNQKSLTNGFTTSYQGGISALRSLLEEVLTDYQTYNQQ